MTVDAVGQTLDSLRRPLSDLVPLNGTIYSIGYWLQSLTGEPILAIKVLCEQNKYTLNKMQSGNSCLVNVIPTWRAELGEQAQRS